MTKDKFASSTGAGNKDSAATTAPVKPAAPAMRFAPPAPRAPAPRPSFAMPVMPQMYKQIQPVATPRQNDIKQEKETDDE